MFQKGDLVTVLDVPKDRWNEGPSFRPRMRPYVGGVYRVESRIIMSGEPHIYQLEEIPQTEDPSLLGEWFWDERWLAPVEEAPPGENLSGILDELYGG